MAHQRQRKRLIAEMNVVPYIDVMLVLLVIFMITSPLLSLTQGVEVDLPKVASAPIDNIDKGPIIISLNAKGDLFLTEDNTRNEAITLERLISRVAALLREIPDRPVLVRGDLAVAHGKVVELMAQLKGIGVAKVGVMTQPPDNQFVPVRRRDARQQNH